MYIFKSSIIDNFKNLNNRYFLNNCSLSGRIIVPGDKSISQRALIISLVSCGKTIIEDILDSEDVYYTLKAVMQLGAKVTKFERSIEIKGVGLGNLISPKQPLFMGNSGTGTRLLLGLVAGSNALVTFFGDSSLTHRPMDRIISPLEEMGATVICSKNKKLPITIKGARSKGFVLPINYKLIVPSAQVKSAILLAALSARGTSYITEFKKTRDYTETMLKNRGVNIKVKRIKKDENIISVDGISILKSKNIRIPGDPSSAAFLAVAAIITKKSSISIENVLHDKLRLNVFSILKKMGANIKIIKTKENTCKIKVKSSKLKNISINSKNSAALIDEYPILAVAAACAEGKAIMKGLGELRFKESNRFFAIINGLTKVGIDAKGIKDDIFVRGSKIIEGGCTIDAKNDHRIAMSFNVLSLVSKKPICIKGNKSIMTSFPSFFKTLTSLGATFSTND